MLGIVRQAGGHVFVDTRVGAGTSFAVYLPRAAESTAGPAPHTETPASVRGDETVLIAESDDVVCRLLADVLRGLGYRVLEAGDGRRALEAARTHGELVHLVVTDTRLPDMTGVALAESLLAEQMAARCLFTMGSLAEADASDAFTDATVLLKPFTPAQLAARVRQALDRTPDLRPSSGASGRRASRMESVDAPEPQEEHDADERSWRDFL